MEGDLPSHGVLREECTGVVTARGARRVVAVAARGGVNEIAEWRVAGELAVTGGIVVPVAVDPREGEAQVQM